MSGGLWAVAIALATFPLRLGVAWNGALDPDESQHLHAAWMVAQGHVPYVDFWEHHTPLSYYLLAPFVRLFTDTPAVYLAARTLMLALACISLALLYFVARRADALVAPVAVAFVCLQPRLIQYMTQVRPDVPALCTWLAALISLTMWRTTRQPRWIWCTGLLLGVTAAFSQKAIYELLGVVVLVVTAAILAGTPARRTLSTLAYLGMGSGVPQLLLYTWLWATGGGGATRAFLRSVVLDSLTFPDPSKRLPFGTEDATLILLAGVGFFTVSRRLRLGVITHPVHGPLLIPAVVISIILLLPTTPAVYEYTWLPVALVAAVYAALGLRALITIRPRPRGLSPLLPLIAIGALVYPAVVSTAAALRNRNAVTFRNMQRELAYACPGDAVFDGTGLYVFRPSASRYAALVVGIRREFGSGRIPVADVVAELRSSRAPVGLWDNRLRIIGGPIASFATRYYGRQPDGLLLAGATVLPSGTGTPGRTVVHLLRDSVYRVTLPTGSEITIDGATISPGLLPLTAGTHVVSWSSLDGPIHIAASTCAERRAVGARE